MDNTIIQQGRFTSDGNSKLIDIRSGVDWMMVINQTQFATTQTPGRGVKFEWINGLAPGQGFQYLKTDATNALNATFLATGGFTLVDPNAVYSPVTGTTITKASPPVCTATAHGFSNGDIVILRNLANMPQIGSVFFTVGNVTANTFDLVYFNTNTANFTAETAFEATKISLSDWRLTGSNISFITTGVTTQVQFTSLQTNAIFAVGDVMKLNVPSVFGVSAIDGQSGEVLSYNATTNTYTIDLDSSGMGTFAWPSSSAYPLSIPNAVKVGTVDRISATSTSNLASLQIQLAAGANSPAGSSGDVIYWVAGKSYNVANN